MRCHHCHQTMQKIDETEEQHTRQTWFECPVCESTQTVTEPAPGNGGQRIGNTLRFAAAPKYVY